MSNISKLRESQASGLQLLKRVPLDPIAAARAREAMRKAEWIADLIYAAGTAVLSSVAWFERGVGVGSRHRKSAFTRSAQH